MFLINSVSWFSSIHGTKSVIVVGLCIPRILWHLFAILQIEHEIEILQFQCTANIIRWLLFIAIDIGIAIMLGHGVTGKFRDINSLTLRSIKRSPCHHVGIQQCGACDKIGTVRAIRSITILALNAIHLVSILSDDIHHGSQSHITIQRRSRSAQNLDMVDLLGTDSIVELAIISCSQIQAVSVFHN